jgi:hypothetical protein
MKRLEKPNWQKQQERKKRMWLIGLAIFLLVPVAVGSVYVINKTLAKSAGSGTAIGDTHLATPKTEGNRIFVRQGDSFQKALNQAEPGDTILLQMGITFKGAFKLPKKNGDKFITIRTSARDSQLPPADKRIDPEKYASVLPKLESDVKGMPVISTGRGAHHFRFIGIEFMPTIEGYYDIVKIGETDETEVEDLPHHIEFDRVYLHGSDKYGQRRGIAANGRHIKIINSYISNIKKQGYESQAIAVWATDGPIIIENNYLEAAGMSILFGGADAPLGLTPTDCIVRNNHLNKRPEWKGTDWVVKNMFEIKNGKNFKVQNNLMTNNWVMGQDGTAVLFTVREDSGKDAVVENIDFSNNIIRGASGAVNVYGSEGRGGRNLTIRNNIFTDINGEKWGGSGFFLKATEWDGLIIENNTIIQNGSITNAYGEPVKNFIFRNNIVFNNKYGFFGDSFGSGKRAINRYFPRGLIKNNIIVGGNAADYGSDNFYPTSIRQVGFTDMNNYTLSNNNPYRSRGTDGKQVGADIKLNEVGGNF